MYNLLIRAMLLAAAFQFGISVSQLSHCRSRQCIGAFEKQSRDILKIDWKPISVFDEEAVRFRDRKKHF